MTRAPRSRTPRSRGRRTQRPQRRWPRTRSGPYWARGGASAEGEPTRDKPLIAAGVGPGESRGGHGAGREREWHLPVHGRADSQLHEPPAGVSHGRESWEEELHQGQARAALCQAAALQRAAEGEHLQVPGHRGPEAGRLHPRPAVHRVVREQLADPEVMELQSALSVADADGSKLVLLSALGSVSCCGLDVLYFIRRLPDDLKSERARMAEAIRNFVNTFIQLKKPIVVAVNGPAIGLGASILPLCDVVWANEKAWFQTPYTSFGQSPDQFHRHVLHDYGRSICQRNAAQRAEASGTGGVQQRAGLTSVLAWDLQPGSHVPHQGARLLQPHHAGGIQGPYALQHEAGAGAGQRVGLWGAQEDMGLCTGHGIHAQTCEEQDWRVLTLGPPDLTRARGAGPHGLGQAGTEFPLQSRTWDRQAIYCQGVLKYCYFQINNYRTQKKKKKRNENNSIYSSIKNKKKLRNKLNKRTEKPVDWKL